MILGLGHAKITLLLALALALLDFLVRKDTKEYLLSRFRGQGVVDQLLDDEVKDVTRNLGSRDSRCYYNNINPHPLASERKEERNNGRDNQNITTITNNK